MQKNRKQQKEKNATKQLPRKNNEIKNVWCSSFTEEKRGKTNGAPANIGKDDF